MEQDKSNKNTYQLSGVDDCERGFSRQVEVFFNHGLVYAVLRYEKLKVAVETCADEERALQELIRRLQDQGYTHLRTQLIFRGTHYLGTQAMWVDYPDQEISSFSKKKWFERVIGWFSVFRGGGNQ